MKVVASLIFVFVLLFAFTFFSLGSLVEKLQEARVRNGNLTEQIETCQRNIQDRDREIRDLKNKNQQLLNQNNQRQSEQAVGTSNTPSNPTLASIQPFTGDLKIDGRTKISLALSLVIIIVVGIYLVYNHNREIEQNRLLTSHDRIDTTNSPKTDLIWVQMTRQQCRAYSKWRRDNDQLN